jgi:hypothetical protein
MIVLLVLFAGWTQVFVEALFAEGLAALGTVLSAIGTGLFIAFRAGFETARA